MYKIYKIFVRFIKDWQPNFKRFTKDWQQIYKIYKIYKRHTKFAKDWEKFVKELHQMCTKWTNYKIDEPSAESDKHV